MNFNVNDKEGVTVVAVEADKLDALIAPELKSNLVLANNKGVKNLIVDLTKVRYCDSSGLSALLVGNRLCNEANGKFAIAGLQTSVKKIIQIAQLDKVLLITESAAQAEVEVNN